MNKKLGVVLTAAMAVTSMTGCGGSSSSTSTTAADTAAADTAAATTAAEAAADKAAADGSEAKAPVGDPIELTFGHGQAEGHPYQQAALYFKDLVEKESGGSITVTVAPNGTLGDERESVEALQMGTMDISVAVAAALSGFDSNMDVFNMPYLFDSREEAFKVLDGEVGQELFGNLESQGIKVFGTYDLGFRSMTNSTRPIETPDDSRVFAFVLLRALYV